MLVSRQDINYDVINETSPQTSFIKVPIKKYLDLLGIDPVPSQIAILNAIQMEKYRFIVAAISRRQGKTYIANIICQMVSLVPGCNVLIIAPDYSLSAISFDLQRKLIGTFGLEVTKDNAKDRVIELANGSTIRIGSVGRVDSTVGRSYDLIIFDEAALTQAGGDAFNVALRPTLDKKGSKAIFISTPRGRKNWFANFFQRGFSVDFPQWVAVQATYRDNPRADMVDVEEARKSMSEAEFRQEYEASFEMYEGQIWTLNHDLCVRDLSELDISGMDVIAGLDIGFRDPTALCILAYDGEYYYLLDEYYSSEKTTERHAKVIEEKIAKWDIDSIFIDSAAQQTRFDLAMTYGISTNDAKKSVLDGIASVGAVVDNDKLIVHYECHRSIDSLDQYQWDPNPNLLLEKPLHNEFSHMSDAIRYAIYSFEGNRAGVF